MHNSNKILNYIISNKKFLIKFFITITITGILFLSFFKIIPKYFIIGIDEQQVKCYPATFYLITKSFNPQKQFACFYPINNQLMPYYNDHQLIFKEIMGRPGDFLKVINDEYFINNNFVGKAKNKDRHGNILTHFKFNGLIPNDLYFVMTSEDHAFDSRYYGFIKKDQFLGNAYPIKNKFLIIISLFFILSILIYYNIKKNGIFKI